MTVRPMSTQVGAVSTDREIRAGRDGACQPATPVRARQGGMVKTCGSGCLTPPEHITSLLILVGSFDELAVDEDRIGSDEGDEVGCVDAAPAALG